MRFANPLSESDDGFRVDEGQAGVADSGSSKLKKIDNPMDTVGMSSDLMLHMQSLDSAECRLYSIPPLLVQPHPPLSLRRHGSLFGFGSRAGVRADRGPD